MGVVLWAVPYEVGKHDTKPHPQGATIWRLSFQVKCKMSDNWLRY